MPSPTRVKRINSTKPHGYSLRRNRAGLAIRTQSEVAEMLGMTRQYVQQIERLAIWKLRHRLAPLARELGVMR